MSFYCLDPDGIVFSKLSNLIGCIVFFGEIISCGVANVADSQRIWQTIEKIGD